MAAWRVTGLLWGSLLFGALALALTWGDFLALFPLVFLFIVGFVGLGTTGVLFFWQLVTGRFRAALVYGLSFGVLVALLFWMHRSFGWPLSHIDKISG